MTTMPPMVDAPPDEMAQEPTAAPPADIAPDPCFDPEANLGLDDIDPGDDGPLSQDERRERVCNRAMPILQDYMQCKERKRAEARWDKDYALAMGWRPRNDPDAVTLPECWRELMTILPQSKGLNLKDWSYKARVPGGEKLAKAATAVVKDQYLRFGSDESERAAKKNKYLYGNAYLVPTVMKFKRTERKIECLYAAKQDREWERQTTEVIYNGTVMRHVQMWNVFTHPRIVQAKDSPAVFIVEGMSSDALKTHVREGYLDPDATKACIDAMAANFRDDNVGRYGQSNNDDDLLAYGSTALHKFVTCWTNGWEFIIVDDKYLLRAQKLMDGKIPIICFHYDEMPEEHYSEGLMDKLAEIQRVVNQLAKYHVVQSGFMANPVLLTKKGTGIKKTWDALRIKHGTSWEVDKLEDAEYLKYPSETIAEISNTIGFWQQAQKNATGITDRLSGQGDNSGTATLGVSLIKAATERLAYEVEGDTPRYREMHIWMYNLLAASDNDVYTVRVAGPEGKEIPAHYTPEIFMPDVDQEISIGSATGPEQVNMWGTIMKFVTGIPGIDPLPICDKLFAAAGEKPEQFRTQEPEGNAMAETEMLMTAGLMPPAKPNQDHQLHLKTKMMAMQTPQFMALNPQWQQTMVANVAQHQQFLQQQMMANAQMQQQSMQPPGKGIGVGGGPNEVQKGANNKANAMFNMGATGAQQQGAA